MPCKQKSKRRRREKEGNGSFGECMGIAKLETLKAHEEKIEAREEQPKSRARGDPPKLGNLIGIDP